MPARDVIIDRGTPMLLHPYLRYWVPEGHLVRFILDAVFHIVLSGPHANHRSNSDAQYPPATMLAQLISKYATARSADSKSSAAPTGA